MKGKVASGGQKVKDAMGHHEGDVGVETEA